MDQVEQFLTAYMQANSQFIYENPSLESIGIKGDCVSFIERSHCGHYADWHHVSLLDLMAWSFFNRTNEGEQYAPR